MKLLEVALAFVINKTAPTGDTRERELLRKIKRLTLPPAPAH